MSLQFISHWPCRWWHLPFVQVRKTIACSHVIQLQRIALILGKIYAMVARKISETIVLSVNVILFGWHQNANNKRVLNYILIIAKYYIFTTNVCDNKLSFDCFLLRLNSKLDVLHTIAIKNKSLNKFETTWAPLS